MRSLHRHFASLAVCLAAAALPGSALAQTPIDANAGSPSPSSGLIPPQSLLQPAHGDWCDNFDRANNTVMGPDWTEWTGDMAILNNHGMGNLSSGWSYMLHTTASDTYADSTMEIDLLPPSGSSGPHVALIAGATAGSTFWFYTKIQDNNSDGSYDRIFFYSSGNGGGWGTQYFQDLTTPVTTGRVKMYFTNSGDTLNVDIDADFNGTYEQH